MRKRNVAPTQRQSHFATSVHSNIQRSTFLRNSTKKTSFNCGYLVPIYIDEVLPNDTFEMDMAFVSRLATPTFPTMDILDLDIYAFFVPNRLVWDGWEALNGENKNGRWTPTTPPALVPVQSTGTVVSRSLGDYYGLPVGANLADVGGVSTLPFRGLSLIWNEWFRDQNHQGPVPIDKGNTENPSRRHWHTRELYYVNKKHDYFTSCLPGPQKGESSLIPIELNELIPVITGQNNLGAVPHGDTLRWKAMTGELVVGAGPNNPNTVLGIGWNNSDTSIASSNIVTSGPPIVPANLWADARDMQINATTIHELRTAFQIQKLYERDARGGTRYVEMLKAHFGVEAQDYRLQRPEFLGHFRTHMGMYQVPQTSHTVQGTNPSPQGNLAAFAQVVESGVKLFKKSFVEHGFLHIFVAARHPKTYQQGIERMWSRRERLDFYMPVLAHISEQPVLNKELYAFGTPEYMNGIFGYNEAWADYRYKPNQVTGQMRSDKDLNTLNYDNWHYADWEDSPPYLVDAWLRDNSKRNVDRTVVMDSAEHDQIIMDIAFHLKATRPMPVHSVPGLVDHF